MGSKRTRKRELQRLEQEQRDAWRERKLQPRVYDPHPNHKAEQDAFARRMLAEERKR